MQTTVELESFIKDATDLFTDDEVENIKIILAKNPIMGDLVIGAAGFRKIRFARAGMGKRGGARIVYFYHNAGRPIF